jgi:hypothetical protein
VAGVLDLPREDLLAPEEVAVLDGRASPEGVILWPCVLEGDISEKSEAP